MNFYNFKKIFFHNSLKILTFFNLKLKKNFQKFVQNFMIFYFEIKKKNS